MCQPIRRGIANGIFMSGGALGNMLMPVLLRFRIIPEPFYLHFSEIIAVTQNYGFSKITLQTQLQALNKLVWVPRCFACPLGLYFDHPACCHYFQASPTYRLA